MSARAPRLAATWQNGVFARRQHERGLHPPHPAARPRERRSCVRATWDEALDRAAAGFRTVAKEHGPQTFGLFSCSKATNEMNFLAQKFARAVIGSNNIDCCNRT